MGVRDGYALHTGGKNDKLKAKLRGECGGCETEI